ncbi:MAG TPA: hypothetical protein DCS73_10960 [Roseburia sp.]|jgi:hypothetical protein|nr:hypothetical protein [Roseburia sp.]
MKFLKIINRFELPRKDIEKEILAKTFLKSDFPLTKIFISDFYNGMHPKKSGRENIADGGRNKKV